MLPVLSFFNFYQERKMSRSNNQDEHTAATNTCILSHIIENAV